MVVQERAAGPRGWRLFQKAEDLGQVVEKVTDQKLDHKLEQQAEAQKIVGEKEHFITGKAPVRLAA